MKLRKVMAAVLSAAMVVSSAMVVSADEGPVTLTLWGAEEDQDLLKELVEDFKAAYPDQEFDISIGVESESTAKDTILTDVEAAADVFAFASDQIYDLVGAGALANLVEYDEAFQAVAGKSIEDVKAANNSGSVTAATVDDGFYAFPFAGDNTIFLYYDSSIVSDEAAQSWDTLLAAAQEGGKKVGMTLNSGWHNVGFFYGAGFTTALNADGTTTIDWNGTSADGYTGVDVTKAMLDIAANPAFQAVPEGDLSNQIASGSLCAALSGTWDATAAQEAFGEGYAATKLPTFTLNGEQVQQGSAFGYKFMGVNAYSENIGWAAVLAEFLTNEQSQVKRFDARQIGPTNLAAAEADSVKANAAVSAAVAQAPYGVIQMVGGKYWDATASFGQSIADGKIDVNDDAAIQAALDELVAGVSAPIE